MDGRNWKVTWEDTVEMGLPEHMIGTKYLRWLANELGAYSPDRDWQWTKDLYKRAGLQYGRHDGRSVERSCRAAIEAMVKTTGCSRYTVSELVTEMAMLAWERREKLGIPDEEGWF